MSNKKSFRNIALYIGIPVLLILIIGTILSTRQPSSTKYSEIVGYFQDQKVEEFSLNLGNGNLEYKLAGSNAKETYSVPSVSLFITKLIPITG